MMMHAFRPVTGTVLDDFCTEVGIRRDPYRECGLPENHPIHAVKIVSAKLTLARGDHGFVEGQGYVRFANTPAHERTGISDRAAAALADVAEVRRQIYTASTLRYVLDPMLDRIEAALRERG